MASVEPGHLNWLALFHPVAHPDSSIRVFIRVSSWKRKCTHRNEPRAIVCKQGWVCSLGLYLRSAKKRPSPYSVLQPVVRNYLRYSCSRCGPAWRGPFGPWLPNRVQTYRIYPARPDMHLPKAIPSGFVSSSLPKINK